MAKRPDTAERNQRIPLTAVRLPPRLLQAIDQRAAEEDKMRTEVIRDVLRNEFSDGGRLYRQESSPSGPKSATKAPAGSYLCSCGYKSGKRLEMVTHLVEQHDYSSYKARKDVKTLKQ